MIIKEKIIDGTTFVLSDNPFYKRSKDNFECKYRVTYFSEHYGSYCFLYHCDKKTDFTKKNIGKYFGFLGGN